MSRISSKKPATAPHFLKPWREKAGLTQQQLADRLETNHENISRWESGQRPISMSVQKQLAEALGIHPIDLWRHPAIPSADALLRDQPQSVRNQVIAIILALTGAN